jgi:hypothetical protein
MSEYGDWQAKRRALREEFRQLEEELGDPPALNSESFAEYVKGTFVNDGKIYYVITPQLLVGE